MPCYLYGGENCKYVYGIQQLLKEAEMKYSIGVDLHKETAVVAVLNEHGELVERKTFSCKCKEMIRAYFASYGLQCQVAYESVGFYQWFWALLKPVVGRLVLADPAGIKAYTGRRAKTDRNDSMLIARLLHEGTIPLAYVPPEPLRELREMTRLRHSIAKEYRRSKLAIRWVSLQKNLPGPKLLNTATVSKWMLANKQKFSRIETENLFHRFKLLVEQEKQLGEIERQIQIFLREHSDLDRQNMLMQSIPGIGEITAATIIAETGDITRFDNPDQLAAYAGLCPRVSQSGETVRHGHISKQGPPLLRWVLQEAAWVAVRCSPDIRHLHNRIARKAGAKKAATAIARKMLVYAWSVSRKGQPFQWPDRKSAVNDKTKGTVNSSQDETFCYCI